MTALPAQPAFIGRVEELRQLTAWLDAAQHEELKAEPDVAKARYEWGRMLCLRAYEQTSDRVSEANRSIEAKGDVERGKGLLEQARDAFARRGMKLWERRCEDALRAPGEPINELSSGCQKSSQRSCNDLIERAK
ncbi:MAG: hypothetical protein AB1665_00820 [Candidatus Thermoplasmatota archaeon]